MKLYEIADQIEMILAHEVGEGGEITEETLHGLTELELELNAKLLALGAYSKGEYAEAAAIDIEIERLKKRSKAHTNRGDRLRKYMADNFPKDAAKISDSRSVIKWVDNPDSVEIDEGAWIPEDLRTLIPADWKPDRRRIKDALDVGVEIKGVRMKKTKRLSIK